MQDPREFIANFTLDLPAARLIKAVLQELKVSDSDPAPTLRSSVSTLDRYIRCVKDIRLAANEPHTSMS